jgi:excisionase family DNA binding protein
MKETKDFLTSEDVAKELKLSVKTVRSLLHNKTIPSKYIAGKYIVTRDSLKKFIDDCQYEK